MEEKYIPTEHLTDHMTRPCEPHYPTTAEKIMNDLKAMAEEETLRATCVRYDQEKPRYAGICTNLGNPVFSDTPVEPPFYTRPLIKYGLEGYQRPIQHPMYTTSSSELGRQPSLGSHPERYYPKDISFTSSFGYAGNYHDTHFTTEIDKTPLSG